MIRAKNSLISFGKVLEILNGRHTDEVLLVSRLSITHETFTMKVYFVVLEEFSLSTELRPQPNSRTDPNRKSSARFSRDNLDFSAWFGWLDWIKPWTEKYRNQFNCQNITGMRILATFSSDIRTHSSPSEPPRLIWTIPVFEFGRHRSWKIASVENSNY